MFSDYNIKYPAMGPSILDREDGDTIAIDFDELYGLYDTDTPSLQPLPVESQTSDLLDNSVWTSGNVIEDSLEAIRSVLSSANLAASNRNIIEKSLTTLRNAMDLPPDLDGLEPDPVTDSGQENWPHQEVTQEVTQAVSQEVSQEVSPGVDQSEVSCYAAVASAAEEEGRVLEALGISSQSHQADQGRWAEKVPQSAETDNLPLFNENFYTDRERQRLEQTDRQLSLWIEDLTSPHLMSPGASLEEISDPQDFLPTSATEISHNHFQPYETLPSSTSSSTCSSSSPGNQYSPSVASVDNVLDQSCLLSGGEGAEAGWGPGGGVTVTRLVPYRIKKIPQDNSGDERKVLRKERQTKDEKMAKYHNLPYTVDHIINCNMEEFTDILNNTDLNNDQLNLCRDIRKRGKNKVKRIIFALFAFLL